MEQIVPENNEQLKQYISLELERARFAGTFYWPVILFWITTSFGLQPMDIQNIHRIFLTSVAAAVSARLFAFRMRRRSVVRDYIKQLKT